MSDGIVYLTADFTAAPGTQTEATIERGLTSTGPWVLIGSVDLLAEVGVFYDTAAPLDTEVWYRWTGSPGEAFIIQGPYIELSAGTVLLKDPLRPWANLELQFCATPQLALAAICGPQPPDLVWVGFGDKVYRADANLFDVYNARVPADIYGVRKRLDGELRILSKTLAAKDAVETLFAGGGPVQIQTPVEYGLPDIIVQPGDLTESYLSGVRDQRRPYRLWNAPFTVVDLPLGPHQGTAEANWCILADTFPTFADLTASGFTWAQVASGEATTPPSVDGYGEGGFGDGPYGDGG
jgi:hypothetical protein